jgi:hypothetical protein
MELSDQLDGFDAQQYYSVVLKEPVVFKGGQVTEHTFKLQFTQALPCQRNALLRMLQFKAVLSHALCTTFKDQDPDLVAQIFVENAALEKKVTVFIVLHSITVD